MAFQYTSNDFIGLLKVIRSNSVNGCLLASEPKPLVRLDTDESGFEALLDYVLGGIFHLNLFW